ncbi:MAG TPA: FAD-binding oxidoreductase, partial [Pseudonocardiaceae bacterium]|nr:FAD-binding oxidoreductase [Pseudonocardiaceae bacterium]
KEGAKVNPRPQPANRSVSSLGTQVKGRLITPDDPDYDRARAIFYGGFDRRPQVIVQAADAADVTRVIATARDAGLELAVRSGGHSPAGHCVIDGGVVLDLSAMRALHLDTETRTAWAEPGLTAGEYTTAAAAHGLATGFGDTASVGIGGITLAGGVGYLVRKHGLTIDNLLAAEVVTADGQLLHADANDNADLFWALRGGGGNFGVATRLRFRLHPLSQVVGGMLLLPASAELVAEFMALAEAAPEELSTIANVMPAPPLPFIPAELHGQLVIIALMLYAGEVEAGQQAVAPFRALAAPLADMVKPMPYPEIYPPEDPNYHPAAVGHTMFLDQVDLQAAETIVDYLRASDASVRVTQLRVLGGAMSRVPADATAFAHRHSAIMANVASFYDGPADKPLRQAWVEQFAAALQQSDDGAYVGFLTDEGPERIRQAYPGSTWDRLVQVKARYDPTNLFHHNHNISAAIEGIGR